MTIIDASEEEALPSAIAALDAGDPIVIPGDVAYLLAADALDDAAVERIFLAKHRGADRPLTILIGGYEDLHHVAYGGSAARELAEAHWPGPTSIALRARPWMPDALTAGQPEVAVSVPRQPFARALAKQFGPLAVAGAKRSGGSASLTVEAARSALGGAAALYIAGEDPLPGDAVTVIRAEAAQSG